MTRRIRARTVTLATMVMLAATPLPAQALIVANDINDICAPSDDPCIIDEVVDVDTNLLDFGVRELRLQGPGQLDIGERPVTIRCGDFVADVPGTALRAIGPDGSTGLIDIEARRQCSGGSRPCLYDSACQLAACNRRRCSLRSSRFCQQDQDCQLGTCIPPSQPNARRCSGNISARCTTNADCNLGVCPEQLTCANGIEAVACGTDEDCDFGSCSIGDGLIDLDGAVMAQGYPAGDLVLEAAGDITVRRTVNVSSNMDQDGGSVTVTSHGGQISLLGLIDVSGGDEGIGGEIKLTASGSLTVSGLINCNGGSYDGGRLNMTAGADIVLLEDILCSGVSYDEGGGYGGEITAAAGRDVRVGGGTPANPTVIAVDGVELYFGEGGYLTAAAGRDVVFEENTAFRSVGGLGGYGGELDLEAGRNVVVDGDVLMTAIGQDSSGGIMQVDAAGSFALGADALVDVSAGEGGGVRIDTLGPMAVAGKIDVGGALHGTSGGVFLEAQSDFELTGSIVTRGKDDSHYQTLVVDIQACDIRFGADAEIDNRTDDGRNRFASREAMTVEAGAVVRTDGAETRVLYRTPAKAPVLQGTFDPVPDLELDTSLPPCPVCANAELEETESCDDGNTSGGDGCSAECQDETCVADTPGYPDQALCDDDDPCTIDACIAGDGCDHQTCDDGIDCTIDACTPEGCAYDPSHAACDDGDVCTDDICGNAGCSNAMNTAPCDDDDECTSGDICSAGTCAGADIPGCGVLCGDGVVEGDEHCDDGDGDFAMGDACRADCSPVPCGRPTDASGAAPKVSDALFVLKVAVGQHQCALSVCDADGDLNVDAGDALRVMRAAVGQAVNLQCPETD
ncbi:MAG TPA: hypothetical protein VEL28_20830 [Candidatus Binatia bacterium]|nr:hypothetical protein [Candidatus Binatia bacterium]